MDSDLIASAPLPKERGVALKEIRLDGNTQCREAMDSEHIDNLVEALEDGASLPAAIVYHDGASYWLADGFHRYHAAQRREAAELWCEVRSGTRLDAVRHAVGANGSHGKPRTNADKRKAVMIALKEFPNLSSRAIAEKCGVSNKTVDQYRPASAPEDRRAGADGKTYSAGRYPGANRAPGDPAPLPDNFRVESKTPTGPTTEEIAQQLAREDRVAKLPALVQRARVVIASIRAIGKKEIVWLLAHKNGDPDYSCTRNIKRDAANRQGVKLPDAVLDLDHNWHSSLGLVTLGNLDHVAVIRTLLDTHLVRASEVILDRGSEGDAGEFIRFVLDEDRLGFLEETPEGRRKLEALAEAQLRGGAVR
jgi:hypothetical protein